MKRETTKTRLYLVTIRALALITLYFASTPTRADGSLTVLTEHFPPFSYERDGQLSGYSVELVRAILDEAGETYQLRLAVWDGAYKLARSQENVLIFSMARTPRRERLFQWVGELARYTTGFYRHRDRTDIQASSLSELKPYRIALLENGPAWQALESLPNSDEYRLDGDRDTILSLDRFFTGRADIVACPDVIANYYLREHGLPQETLIALPPAIDQNGLYLAASLKTSVDRVDRLRVAYENLNSRGFPNQLKDKWLNPHRSTTVIDSGGVSSEQ